MKTGDIVRATAGKDKGKVFLLISCTEERGRIVNGRRRRVQRPKLKSLRHLEMIAHSDLPEPLTNKVVLKLLKPYTTEEFKEES